MTVKSCLFVLPVIVFGLALALPTTATAADCSCECLPCCCPPPPVHTVLCLTDPCTCCTVSVDLCIPACCSGEQPCITWRNGVFGRRVATLSWNCCDYAMEVVTTRRGRVIVRG